MTKEYLLKKLANIRKQRGELVEKQKTLNKHMQELDLLIHTYEFKIAHWRQGIKYNGKKYKQMQKSSVMEQVFADVCRKYGSGTILSEDEQP